MRRRDSAIVAALAAVAWTVVCATTASALTAADRQLGQAITARDLVTARQALDAGASPNADFGQGMRPLMLAAQLAPVELVDLLLDRGAEVNARAVGGQRALMSAVQMALERRPDRDPAPTIRRLAAAGADLEAQRDDGDTSLHLAAAFDLSDVAQVLLAVGANPNARSSEGRTPLIVATKAGHAAVVRVLLDARADPDLLDAHGRSALDYAAMFEFPAVAESIERSRGGRPPPVAMNAELLQVAARDGAIDRLRAVLAAGIAADATDPFDPGRRTALLGAADAGHLAAVEVLLAHGANPLARDANGRSALGAAGLAGHTAVTERLLADPRVVPAIIAELRDASPLVRNAALLDAGLTRSELVIAPLGELLLPAGDAADDLFVVQALTRLDRPGGRPLLEMALESPSEAAATAAATALARRDPQAARARARALLRRSAEPSAQLAARQILAVTGDHAYVARIDRWRRIAPALLPLLLLAAVAACCLLSLRSWSGAARRIIQAACDALLAGGATGVILLICVVLVPGGGAVVGLPTHPQPYAEGAALFAVLAGAFAVAVSAWFAALVSFVDLALPSRWVRSLLKAAVAATLIPCIAPIVVGAEPLGSPLGLFDQQGMHGGIAFAVGMGVFAQGLLRGLVLPNLLTPQARWRLDRLGVAGFVAAGCLLILMFTSGAHRAAAAAGSIAASRVGAEASEPAPPLARVVNDLAR